MYSKTAKFYDDLHSFMDYGAMSQRLINIIQRNHPAAENLLEVACGTGAFIRNLRNSYRVEGLDVCPEMLEVAAVHCPGVPLHLADMVDFDLPGRFDVVVCLFSSIAVMKTVERMQRAVERMACHLNAGGLLLVEPFFTPETCWDRDLRLNTYNGKDRKIAWMYVTEVKEKTAISDMHYLVGEPTGVKHFTERHELGLFTDTEYREALERVGMTVSYDPAGAFGRGMYIGTARASRGNGE